jgi:signal transduction histidine kinase
VHGVRAGILAAAVVSGAVGFAFAVLPQLQLTYQGTLPRVALETAALLIALLAGFLVFGRLHRRGDLNDLLLACALAVLVLLNLFLLTMPALAPLLSKDLIAWVLLMGNSLGAVLFALSAFAPRRRVRRPGLVLAVSVVGGIAIVLLMAAMLREFAGHLSYRPVIALPADSATRSGLGQHAWLLALHLATVVLYSLASIGFLRSSRHFRDEFLGWLAISGGLGSLAHLNYSLYSVPYVPLIHNGDIFRLSSYVMLLVGSMREISSYWHALSEAAVLDERQRIARDLHDGLAQELAYLARNLDSIDGEDGEQTFGHLREAVCRAQLESRRIVNALGVRRVEPVEVALAEAAAQVADRFHLGLELDLVHGVKVSVAREDALVRIAREAVANAARHSGAPHVNLKLERDGSRLRLRVSDQGCGFDPTIVSGGFGLVSMHEHARSVGGKLRISSTPGAGSEVEAAL